jgi:Asp-tRNA(Asn)/Glu-tRNA(Gln) amidotransferase B subunit
MEGRLESVPPSPLPKDCERALNFLMGQVMKETQGKANPQIVRRLLLERLDAE